MITIYNWGGHIVISGLPSKQKEVIKKGLQLPNPMYYKLLRIGNYRAAQWSGQYISYFKEDKHTGDLVCGRGTLQRICNYLSNCHIAFKCVDNWVEAPVSMPKSSIILRDYQEPVFEDIAKSGAESFCTKLSTGFGKSIIALKIAENLQQRTLIICPRTHLVETYRKDIKNLFGFDAGIIQGDKCDIKDITVATLQTLDSMVKKKTIHAIADKFGLCIFDEIQTLLTKKKIKVVQSFKCRFLVGVTATLENEQEQGKSLEWILGPVVSEHELPMAKPEVVVYNTNINIPVRDYPDSVLAMVENEERNILIAKAIIEKIKEGRKIIIFVKRIAHLALIDKHLPKSDGIKTLYATNKKEQLDLLEGIRKGNIDFDVILASFSFLAVGTDCPLIDCVCFAGDLRGHTLTTQALGRSTRILENKPNPIILDFHDNLSPIFHKQFLHRRKLYNDKGYKIIYASI